MARGTAALRAVSTGERVPPHNLEAEQSLLGSMFLSRDAVETALAALAPEDFYRPAHGRIFAAVRHLHERGEPIDAITVADRLEATGELDDIGGKPYLLTVTGIVPTAANAVQYAEIIRRSSMLRDLINAATEVSRMCYENQDDLDFVIEEAEKRVFDVTKRRVETKFETIHDLMKDSFKNLEELYDRKEHITGVPTGFVDLDKILAGLHRSDLVILAARPAVGKTALALNMAVNAAKQGFPVAVFSLEMAAEQLVQRMMCSEANVDSQRIRTGYLDDTDWPKLMKAMGRLDKCPIWVDDTPAISIMEVRAKARRLFKDKANGLIIVDYLQLMQPSAKRTENRQVEIADISRGLKMLAKDLNVPVLALSQLSRAVEQRQGKRPQLSDLRESGSLEQDSDVVMFIHRNTDIRPGDDGDYDGPGKGEAEIVVAKHRNGPVGSCTLLYKDRITKFENFTTKTP